jgi:hypothetical protein
MEYCTCPNGYNLTMVDNVTGICESKYNFNISTFIDHTIVRSMFMLSFIFVIVCILTIVKFMYIYRFTSDVGQVHVHLQVYFRCGTGTCTSTGLLQTWDRYMSIYRFTSDMGQVHEMYMYLSQV